MRRHQLYSYRTNNNILTEPIISPSSRRSRFAIAFAHGSHSPPVSFVSRATKKKKWVLSDRSPQIRADCRRLPRSSKSRRFRCRTSTKNGAIINSLTNTTITTKTTIDRLAAILKPKNHQRTSTAPPLSAFRITPWSFRYCIPITWRHIGHNQHTSYMAVCVHPLGMCETWVLSVCLWNGHKWSFGFFILSCIASTPKSIYNDGVRTCWTWPQIHVIARKQFCVCVCVCFASVIIFGYLYRYHTVHIQYKLHHMLVACGRYYRKSVATPMRTTCFPYVRVIADSKSKALITAKVE